MGNMVIRFMSALWGDFALSVLGMVWFIAWLTALVCSWNDWAFMAWVLLTIAPVGYPYGWHQRQDEKWSGRCWDLVHAKNDAIAKNRRLAERR